MRKARSPACNNDTRPSRKRNARGGRRAAPPATKEHGESRRRNAVGEDGGQPRLVRRRPLERERRRVHHLRAEYANLGAGRRHRAVCSEHRVKTTEKKTVNTAEYGQLNTCPLGRWLGYMNTYSASRAPSMKAERHSVPTFSADFELYTRRWRRSRRLPPPPRDQDIGKSGWHLRQEMGSASGSPPGAGTWKGAREVQLHSLMVLIATNSWQ